jgi:hypothetical protein
MEEEIRLGRAEVVGHGLLCPERGGGVVLLIQERSKMVDAFSAVLTRRPPSYGWLHIRSQQGMGVLHFFLV